MGEVYKARDIRLDRFVAIKVLPTEVASDPERLRRFEQEARAASALNHPNILTIYDVGSADSISYIAMELVEGKTLRDLLLKGPLPVKRLLELAVQIADGLASAHEAGIVHRDLKPSNIVISKDGFAKILDFGLAKLPTPAPKLDSGDSDCITESISETQPGLLLGTVDYMSPEQAAGKEVDYQSDQFAFGSILYEMITGKRAFRRGTNVETLAAILHSQPEAPSRSPIETPAPLLWILERCLAKQPADRFLSTRDLSRDLVSLRDHLSQASPLLNAPIGRLALFTSRRVVWILAIAILTGTLVTALVRRGSHSSPLSPVRVSLLAEPGSILNFESSTSAPVAISPSGEKVVFGATDASGRDLLWVRSLHSLTSLQLSGTEGAIYPFWSPDERFIGFFAEGKLCKISSAGGPPQTVCGARDGRGGSWSSKGIILFAPDSVGEIFEVPESGGDPKPVTKEKSPRSSYSHRWPALLPDEEHFLYLAHYEGEAANKNGIYVGSRLLTESQPLLRDISNTAYVAPGYLLFLRDGVFTAARFDSRLLRLTGNPVTLGEQVAYHPYRWNGAFSVSANGTLAYQGKGASGSARLSWFDRSGARLESIGDPGDYGGIRLSPDGQSCALERRDPSTSAIDIWVLDLSRGVSTRLTSGVTCVSPTWSPDSNRIVFASNRDGRWNIYVKAVLGSADNRTIYQSPADSVPTDWSPGGSLLFNSVGRQRNHSWEIWQMDVNSGAASPRLHSGFNNRDACFSPDGKLLAYVSDESGRQEVYIRRSADDAGVWRVSSNGGRQPVWRRDGRELFYVSGDNKLMAVRRARSGEPEIGTPEILFELSLPSSATDIPQYSASADGRRFLVVSRSANTLPPAITVVLNWTAELGH